MVRTRTRPTLARAGRVEFIECSQAGMCVVTSMESLPTSPKARALALNGAFVKFCPTIRASERSSVDARAIRELFMKEGAAAVVIAPIVIPDVPMKQLEQTQRKLLNSADHVREWFADVKAPKQVIHNAVDEALRTLEEAGL